MDTNIVMFPRQPRRPTYVGIEPFKLRAADKIDICRWEAEGGSHGVARIAIHEGSGVCEEDADVALLYAPSVPWARWGVARRGSELLLWRCNDGQDLGLFGSMREAIDAASFGRPVVCAPPRLQSVPA